MTAETISERQFAPCPMAKNGGFRTKNFVVTQAIEFTGALGGGSAITCTAAAVQRLVNHVASPTTADDVFYMDITHSTGGKRAMYVISTMTATTGNNTAGRFRAESAGATKSSGETYGVHGQGIVNATLAGSVVNAVYGEAISKTTSTVDYLRGGFFAADSEGTPTSIGQMEGCHVRVKTSVAPTNLYGLIVETEKLATGITADAMIEVRDTTWQSGSVISTHGLSFNTTGDFTNTIYTSSNTTYFVYFSANTGKGVETGSLKDSDAADIKCDAYIKVLVNATPYYIALYDTTN